MGTRSLVKFVDPYDSMVLTTVYRQLDGYPSGRGQELANFLKGMKIVNGYGLNDKAGEVANGMGCLAAQWIAREKEDTGGVYIERFNAKGVGEDYIYQVLQRDSAPYLRVIAVGYGDRLDRVVFEGKPEDFDGEAIEAEIEREWETSLK